MKSMLRSILHKILSSILFNPAWIAQSRLKKYITKAVSTLGIRHSDKWLDVGCGSRPYESLFPCGTYTGVDVNDSGRPTHMKSPDYFYDGRTLPFPDQSFDGVLCTQVLEHVANPEVLLSEINRVLKPEGTLVLSAPFSWGEHEEPYDFFRFSTFGFHELLTRCNFGNVAIQKTTGTLEAVAQLLSIYFATNIFLPIRGLGRALQLFICFPIQFFGLLLQRILPDSKRLYLDCVIVAHRKV